MSPRHKKNKLIHPSSAGIADKATVERRKKEKEKFYERTEVIMGKCLLHRETDASKVDPEVRAFVGMDFFPFTYHSVQFLIARRALKRVLVHVPKCLHYFYFFG